MNVSVRLKQYIEENGLKHKHVANKAGIDPKKFSRIINGHTKLTVDELELICEKGLSVNPALFFN